MGNLAQVGRQRSLDGVSRFVVFLAAANSLFANVQLRVLETAANAHFCAVDVITSFRKPPDPQLPHVINKGQVHKEELIDRVGRESAFDCCPRSLTEALQHRT
jgi:hypothetical protein